LHQLAIAVLSVIITLVANTAANLMPRQAAANSQASASASSPQDNGVEYGSLQSPSLGKELKYAVQLPPSYKSDTKRRYPVLYFLHGMNGNEGEFQRRGVAAEVSKLRDEKKIGEFIIVAPAGENSFYLNSKSGVLYEDAIIKDLIPHIEKTYRTMGTTSGRAIQGISMGGWGALMLAFKHPEMFSSVSTHSAALYDQLPKVTGTDRYYQFLDRTIKRIFGDPPDEAFFQANNPLHLAETNAPAIKKSGLKIYFDVGEQDRYGYQASNKMLDERLTKAGVPHEFHLFPGNHGWEYMISVADHSYTFLWKSFKPDGKASASSRSRSDR
ncbi:MAG TPA: alpha/beta hydrolase family protein, partial [Blastocatellia bacterium]